MTAITEEEREVILAEVEFVGDPANLPELSPVCWLARPGGRCVNCLYPRLLQEICILRDARSLPLRVAQAKRLVAAAGLDRPARRLRFNEGGGYRVRLRYVSRCAIAHCRPYGPVRLGCKVPIQFCLDDVAVLAEAYALKPRDTK